MKNFAKSFIFSQTLLAANIFSAYGTSTPFIPNHNDQIHLGSKTGDTSMHARGGAQFINPKILSNESQEKFKRVYLKAIKLIEKIENHPDFASDINRIDQTIQEYFTALNSGQNLDFAVNFLERIVDTTEKKAIESGINLNNNQNSDANHNAFSQENESNYSNNNLNKVAPGGFSYWGDTNQSQQSIQQGSRAPQRPLQAIIPGQSSQNAFDANSGLTPPPFSGRPLPPPPPTANIKLPAVPVIPNQGSENSGLLNRQLPPPPPPIAKNNQPWIN